MEERFDTKADAGIRNKIEDISEFVSQNWLRLVALVVTGVLTGYAGWNLTHNWFFTGALVALAEGASLFWTARASDNGNPTQERLSYVGAFVAWVAIVLTDLASATFLANESAKFEIFAKVPEWSQNVVTFVLPALAVVHGVLGTAHHYFSEEAKLHRDLAKTRRDAKRQVAEAKSKAEIDIARAEANRFRQLAQEGAEGIGIRRGEALWKRGYGSGGSDGAGEVQEVVEMEGGQPVPFPMNGQKKPRR